MLVFIHPPPCHCGRKERSKETSSFKKVEFERIICVMNIFRMLGFLFTQS